MKIRMPMTSQLPKLKGQTIKTKMKGSHMWLIGEKLESGNWNIYVECKEIDKRKVIGENETTEVFNILSNLAKNNSFNFNYTGTEKNLTSFSNYIKKLLKKNY